MVELFLEYIFESKDRLKENLFSTNIFKYNNSFSFIFNTLTWLLWKCNSTSYDENTVNYEPQFHCTRSIIRLAI